MYNSNCIIFDVKCQWIFANAAEKDAFVKEYLVQTESDQLYETISLEYEDTLNAPPKEAPLKLEEEHILLMDLTPEQAFFHLELSNEKKLGKERGSRC